MIIHIQQQMENDDDCIFFDDNRQRGIAKFAIEVDKEVGEFLERFQYCVSFIFFEQFNSMTSD